MEISIYIDVDYYAKDGSKFAAYCSTPLEQNVIVPVVSADPIEALEAMLDLIKVGIRHEGGDLQKYIAESLDRRDRRS